MHQTWTIPLSWYTMPYLEVKGVAFAPLNLDAGYVAAGQYLAPNWCLSVNSSWL